MVSSRGSRNDAKRLAKTLLLAAEMAVKQAQGKTLSDTDERRLREQAKENKKMGTGE